MEIRAIPVEVFVSQHAENLTEEQATKTMIQRVRDVFESRGEKTTELEPGTVEYDEATNLFKSRITTLQFLK